MKKLDLLKYFFYLATNWNPRIAWHIIIQEIKGEKKYGINTTGADELKKLEAAGIDVFNSTIYMPASYDVLDDIFKHLPLSPRNHFLDIGCGKGRALCVAAYNNYKKITGIDFYYKLCNEARKNAAIVSSLKKDVSFSVVVTDAVDYAIPVDVDCIFLFNPFDEIIMEEVVNNIIKSINSSARKIYIVYVNPLHKALFTKKAFTEIYYSKRLQYLEVSILENN